MEINYKFLYLFKKIIGFNCLEHLTRYCNLGNMMSEEDTTRCFRYRTSNSGYYELGVPLEPVEFVIYPNFNVNLRSMWRRGTELPSEVRVYCPVDYTRPLYLHPQRTVEILGKDMIPRQSMLVLTGDLMDRMISLSDFTDCKSLYPNCVLII